MAGESDRPDGRFHRARRDAARPGRLAVEVAAAGASAGPARGLSRWLAAAAPPRAAGSVSIAVVSDARMRALNRRYRGKDRVTDVLSFSTGPGPWPSASRRHEGAGGRAEARRAEAAGLRPPLGEVVIAAGRARRQAADAGHSLATELRVLALHGLLHLLGYDHERDDGRMARVERALRRRVGLREGLIERAGAPARRRERRR
jgi:probable rRNA maturation factor